MVGHLTARLQYKSGRWAVTKVSEEVGTQAKHSTGFD